MTFFVVETYKLGGVGLEFMRSDDHVAIFFSRHAAEDFRDAIGAVDQLPVVATEPIELLQLLQEAFDAGVACYAISPDTPQSCLDPLDSELLSDPGAAFEKSCQALAELMDSSICPSSDRPRPVHVYR